MDEVHVIRHKHFKEGKSIRRIARDMGLQQGLPTLNPEGPDITHAHHRYPHYRILRQGPIPLRAPRCWANWT